MAWDRTLPPDTRSLNSPDPADDHNKDVKALAELRAKLGDLPDAAVDSLFKWNGSKLVEIPSGTFAKAQRSSIIAGIGSGGDYATINAALDDIADRFFVHSNPSFDVELQLLDGFVVAEQLFTTADLSRFRLTQQSGATVTIDRSAITTSDPGSNTEPVFLAYNGGKLPVIDCFFDLDSSGVLGNTRVFKVRDGAWLLILATRGCSGQAERLVEVSHGARGIAPQAVVKDGPGIGVRVSNGSVFHIGNGEVSGCDFNITADNSRVHGANANLSGALTDGFQAQGPTAAVLPGANLSGAGRRGLYGYGAAQVNFEGGDASSCGTNGVLSESAASINCNNANGRKGASDDPADLRVSLGGFMSARGATGGLSQTPNRATALGLIINEDVTWNSGMSSHTGDGSTTIFNVAHGLSEAPSVRNIWAENSNAKDWAYIGSADATNIEVVFDTAPADGASIVFGFEAAV